MTPLTGVVSRRNRLVEVVSEVPGLGLFKVWWEVTVSVSDSRSTVWGSSRTMQVGLMLYGILSAIVTRIGSPRIANGCLQHT